MTWFFLRRLIQFLIFIGSYVAVVWNQGTPLDQVDLMIWKSQTDLNWSCLWLGLLLVLVYWGLEAFWFNVLLLGITNLRLACLFRSVLGCISLSMLLPINMGAFSGRLVFSPINQCSATRTAIWSENALQSVWILGFGGWILVIST